MFKEWLHIFQKDSLMDRAYRRSSMMLDITLSMFLNAKTSLRNTDSNQIDIDIYDRDAEVNRYQREVSINVRGGKADIRIGPGKHHHQY